MKIQTNMKSPVLLLQVLVAAAVVCLLPATPVRAADSAAKAAADQAVARPGHDLTIVQDSLKWNGPKRKDNQSEVKATIANVVDLLRELFPEANFIVSPGIGEMVVSDLKLRNANAEEALRAVCLATGPMVAWRNDSAVPPLIDPVTGLPTVGSPGSKKPMYVLYENPAGQVYSPKPKPQIEAFSIGDYLAANLAGITNAADRAARIDQILSELHDMVSETTQLYQKVQEQMDRSSKSSGGIASMRFHPNAGLLVVTGDPDAVFVASKVLGALPSVRNSNYQPAVQMREVPVAVPASPGNSEPIFPAPVRRPSGAPR